MNQLKNINYRKISERGEDGMERSFKLKKIDEYKKALYIVDMNNGFVNFGAMANPEYNKLVPEQLKLIKRFREEGELINFILEGHISGAREFDKYPEHCVMGTPEAELIPEFVDEQYLANTNKYFKNCINGMFNQELQKDIIGMKNLREIIVEGVCTDLCVMYFVINMLTYLDEINKDVSLFVVKNAIDTFDAPGHSREEWTEIAYKVMQQAGAILVDDFVELEQKEKQLKLR